MFICFEKTQTVNNNEARLKRAVREPNTMSMKVITVYLTFLKRAIINTISVQKSEERLNQKKFNYRSQLKGTLPMGHGHLLQVYTSMFKILPIF